MSKENPKKPDFDPTSCQFGNYPWDRWQKTAIEAGVAQDVASVGSEAMREAYNHSWDDSLKRECGWDDEGKAMIKLALRSPKKAKAYWAKLVQTDGMLGQFIEQPDGSTWKSFGSRGN